MKYKDLLVKLNHLVKVSDLFPDEALQLLQDIDIEAPNEFKPLLIALKEYLELKKSNILIFFKNLPDDLKDKTI